MKPGAKFTVLLWKTVFPFLYQLWFLPQPFLNTASKPKGCFVVISSKYYIRDETMCACRLIVCVCVCASVIVIWAGNLVYKQGTTRGEAKQVKLAKFCFLSVGSFFLKEITRPPTPYTKKNIEKCFLIFLLLASPCLCVRHSYHWLQFPWSQNRSGNAWTQS